MVRKNRKNTRQITKPIPSFPTKKKEHTIQEGSTLGHYQVLEELGRGGMGRVHKTRHIQGGPFFALKLLISAEASDEDVKRFAREAKAMSRLQHPNIIRIYDIGYDKGYPFFIMDYLEGESLGYTSKVTRLSYRQITEIMIKLTEALDCAHAQGVIHRDLKPQNVMMHNDEPKIMDFGLAKLEDVSDKLSQTGMMIGTLQYMPPEQAEGKPNAVDARSDVYGLGTIFYELLAGQPPFTGKSSFDLVYQIMEKHPTPPSKMKKRVPKELENICLKALEKAKKRRYQTVKDFQLDLQRFLKGQKVLAPSVGKLGILLRKAERHKEVAIVYSLVILMLLVGCFLWGIKAFSQNKDIPGKEKTAKKEKTIKKENTGKVIKKEKVSFSAKQETNTKAKAEQYNAEGNGFFKQKRYISAIEKYTLAISLDPNFTDAYNNRGAAYTSLKNSHKAIENYNKAIALNPSYVTAYTNRARAFRDLGQFQKALNDYNTAIKLAPKNIKAYFLRGITYMKMKAFQKALNDYSHVLKLNPNDREAYLNIGYIFYIHKKYDVAIKNYNRAIEIQNNFALAYLHRANAYWDTNNHSQARLDYQKYLQLVPNDSQRQKIQKRINSQTNTIKTPPKENSDKAIEFYNTGNKFFHNNQLREAIQSYNQAVAHNPKYADAYNNLGAAYLKLKDAKKALSYFDQAITVDPQHADAYSNRGDWFYRRRNIHKALENYNKSLAANPQHRNACASRGILYLKNKNYRRAVSDLTKAIKLVPKGFDRYFYRAQAYHQWKKPKLALADLNLAIKMAPRYYLAYNYRGLVYNSLGDDQKAFADFKKTMSLNPKFPQGHLNYGKMFIKKGQNQKAIPFLRTYLQLRPNSPEGQKIRAFIAKNKKQ